MHDSNIGLRSLAFTVDRQLIDTVYSYSLRPTFNCRSFRAKSDFRLQTLKTDKHVIEMFYTPDCAVTIGY